jgi:hypothetical protein
VVIVVFGFQDLPVMALILSMMLRTKRETPLTTEEAET